VSAAAVAVAALTAACAVGQPRDFAARADRLCAGVNRSLDHLTEAAQGVPALRWASTRHTDIEHLVAQLTDDTGLPGGGGGIALRDKWLRPARASLTQGLTDLETLRQAIRHDPAAVGPALAAALRAGTAGVDTGYLTEQHMPACALTFTAPTATDVPAPVRSAASSTAHQ
jgi:hypothetical protein